MILTHREKFLRTCRFENAPPPRYFCFGWWESTLERWRGEGLADGGDPLSIFGMDQWINMIPVVSGYTNTPFVPGFERKIVSEDDESVTYVDASGIIKRERKDMAEKSMPQFLEFPVRNRSDWDSLKWRLDADSPERYPVWDDLASKYAERDYPLAMTICGAYGLPRNLFGEEHLAYAYYDDPALLHEIMTHWVDLNKTMLSRVCEHVIPDYVYLWEDMAYKNGPLISPAMFDDFMFPYYISLIGHIKSCGIENIVVDSDGDIRPIIPGFIKAGVTALLPLEIAANTHPLELRAQYPDLVLWGGIDKRELAKGYKAIEREVMGKLPEMLKYGGYIPTVDHSVPPDVSWDNFTYFAGLMNELCAD